MARIPDRIQEADDARVALLAADNFRCTRPWCRRPATHTLRTPGANPALTSICTKHAWKLAGKHRLAIEPPGVNDIPPRRGE